MTEPTIDDIGELNRLATTLVKICARAHHAGHIDGEGRIALSDIERGALERGLWWLVSERERFFVVAAAADQRQAESAAAGRTRRRRGFDARHADETGDLEPRSVRAIRAAEAKPAKAKPRKKRKVGRRVKKRRATTRKKATRKTTAGEVNP